MKEEAFLQPLVLKQKPRLGVQLLTSVVLVVVAVTAYYSFPDTCDSPGFESSIDGKVKEPALWFSIMVALFSLVPAFFLVNLIRSELKLNTELIEN